MKTFKRAISSILAFVMVFSMITVLNVSSVFAATATVDAANFFKAASSSSSTKIDPTTTSCENDYATVAVSSTYIVETLGSRATAQNKTFKNDYSTEINPSWEMRSGGTRTITVTPKTDCTAYIYGYSTGSSGTIKVDGSENVYTDYDGTVGRYQKDCTANTKFTLNLTTNAVLVGIVFVSNSTEPSLKLDPAEIKIAPGSTGEITATLNNSTDTIEYTSDTEGVTVTATATGATIAVADTVTPGTTATITATAGTITATATVKCNLATPVESITITPASGEVYVGKTITLTADVQPTEADNKEVTWTSSNTNVATVDNGKVTGVAAGTATITAKTADGGYTASAEITVKAMPVIANNGSGSVNNLVAATENTVYNLLSEANSAGFDNANLTNEAAYIKETLYFNNELFVAGSSGLLYNYDKQTTNLDGTTNKNGGIRLKTNQDVVALRLAAGSTVELYVTGGGGSSRYATISSANSSSPSGDLVKSGDLINNATEKISYTSQNGEVVYISATGDSFISQIRVLVAPIVQATTDGTEVGVWADTSANTYYIACVVKASELAEHDNVAPAYNGTALTGTKSDTVYKAADFENNTYTAADFGGGDTDYLYIVGINGGTFDASNILKIIKEFTRTFDVSTESAE